MSPVIGVLILHTGLSILVDVSTIYNTIEDRPLTGIL